MTFNVTAFQLDAFQSGAFQQEVATEVYAFQRCVFQWNAFQVEECTEPVIVEISGGGGIPFTGEISKTADEDTVKQLPTKHPWIHFPEQSKEKKPDYGIIKSEIAEIAVKAVSKALEKRTVKDESLDIAIAEKQMREMLKEENKRWLKAYLQVLMVEYYRQEQENEDAQIAMLLFEM
jgi:hypothetical protein